MSVVVVGLLLACVLGAFVEPPGKGDPVKTLVVMSLLAGVFAGVMSYVVGDLRGADLAMMVVLWTLILPALRLGDAVRERVQPR